MNNQHLGGAKFLDTKSRIDLLAEKKKMQNCQGDGQIRWPSHFCMGWQRR